MACYSTDFGVLYGGRLEELRVFFMKAKQEANQVEAAHLPDIMAENIGRWARRFVAQMQWPPPGILD